MMVRPPRARRILLALASMLATVLLLPASAPAFNAIEGVVSAPAPVDEVEVCVVEALPSETCTLPKPSGAYVLTLKEAGVYRVQFLPSYRSHLVAQYYNHKAKLSEATKIVLNANQAIEHVDADLELGGVIEGRATAAASALGLQSVEVCAQDATTGAAVSCSHTDANGDYALPSVPPGSYRVGFWGERESAAYAPEYYDGQASFLAATPVPVSADTTVTGIDAELDLGARVSGVVTDAANQAPLAGIAVCILKSTAAGPERCAYTGPAGDYTLPGVSSGSYQLAFSPEFNEYAREEFVLPEEDGWHTQYYAGSATRAGSTSLSLTAPQQRSGIDAALLSTFVPPPPAPPPPAPNIAIPAPTILTLPPAKAAPKKCRKGFKKRKARCVKVHKKKRSQKR
jgi:Carboxypeptidase regulatory-like domain